MRSARAVRRRVRRERLARHAEQQRHQPQCASAPQCSSKSSAVDTSLNRHDAVAVQERGARRRIAFAQTDEFKHTREVHVWLLAQGVDERKWEARKNRKTQTSFSQSVGELIAISRRAHVCNRKSSRQRHRQQRRAHSKQQVAALVGASVANAGQHGAHSKQLLATARRESARHASLSTHRCCDAKRTRARTAPSTPSAVPGVAACSSLPSDRSLMCTAVVFWTRANVEHADFEPAAPLRCDTSRSHSSLTARRRPRAEHAAT